MTHKLPTDHCRLLRALHAAGGPRQIPELAAELELDQSPIAAMCATFASEGLVRVDEQELVELSLTPEGQAHLASGEPLVERRIAQALAEAGTPLATPEIAERLGIGAQEVGKALRFVLAKGYAAKQGKALVAAEADLQARQPDEELLEAVAGADGTLVLPAAEAESGPCATAIKDLRSRGLVKCKTRKQRFVTLTGACQEMVDEGIEELQQVNQLTEAMLLSGEWRSVELRPYDVRADAAPVYPGRIHPLRRVLESARRAFLNMGFEEIRGPYVESAFWDFDALFQPQDHPARDMQDTFYCGRPERFELPDEALVETIRGVHEHGGSTGSTGWRYRWNPDRARQVVLRTHTTSVTIHACHDNPRPPRKVFCVGRVFRRESIDYKHLPEFHQVDGVIIDEHASFATLLGTLGEFYRQMGFEQIKFKPAFFPYTEPSVEAFVRLPGRQEWLEMGGAGVFRPEVTRPAGVSTPVLAWGLGLERLAMVRQGLEDIRMLYLSKLEWLRESL